LLIINKEQNKVYIYVAAGRVDGAKTVTVLSPVKEGTDSAEKMA